MNLQEIVVMAAVAGIAIGLLIVPVIAWGRRTLAIRSESKRRAGRSKHKAGQPRQAAAVADAAPAPVQKRRGRPAKEKLVKKEPKVRKNSAATKKRPGPPSKAELARRAEAARGAESEPIQVQVPKQYEQLARELQLTPEQVVILATMPLPSTSDQQAAAQ